MEPIAELEDDDDGFGFDSSPSSHRLPNHNSNHRPESPSSVSGQFRSRSNTWPQFSVDYDKLAGNEQNEDDEEVSAMMIGMPHLHPMDDIRESEDNDDDDHSIGPPPYGTTFYELSYHHHHQHHQPDSLDPELLHQHHQAAYSPGEFSSVGGVSDGGSSQPQHHHHHHHHQQQHHHHHSHHHSTSADSHLIRQPPHSPFYSPVPGVGPNSANPASTNQSGVSGAEFSSRCDPLDISSGGVLHNGDATDDVLSGPVTEGDPAAAEGGPDGPGTASAKSASALKKNTSRRNAWGNMSYADLITQAINGSPDKRLTLSQIYEWMVQNVTYFKDKGDSNSSAGWKNSIRHNLSLHNRFMRVQNEGTGKSSWWMINPDAKPGKAARRRAISMETNNYEKRRGRVKRRVEQLRAGMAGIGRSDLSGSLGPLSSSSGSSSYKLVGSTSSLLSGNASLSNLNLSETGPSGCHSNPHLVASPSSTESFDLFSESNPLNVGNHFHSNPPNYSPSEFRPRASSNASSTCSTVNLMMDSNDNHQVTPLSPLNWNADMRVYGPNGGSYHNSSHNNVHGSNNEQLQLIDCLANLGTGPSTHNSGTGPYRMMAEKDQQMLHKNGLIGCRTSQDSSSDMMLLGSDVGSGEQAASAASHNYTDLFKMQQPQHPRLPQSTSAGAVSSSASASPISSQKPSFTSLDSPSSKASSNNLSTSYFRTPSLMDLPPSATKLHEMNNKPSGGTISYENSLHNRFADSRLSQNRLQALNSGLTSYQHHSPGKLYGLGLYTTDSGCYVPDYETLNSFAATHGAPLASGHDLDLDIDPMQSGMLDCDVDQVIRHELSVDGSLDFGLASSASNVDSSTTCSSTSTKPTSTRSPNAYTMHTTDLHLRSALDNSACYSQAMHPSPAQLSSFYSPGSSGSPTSTNGTRTYITLAPCSTITQDEINQSKSVAASIQSLNANSRIRLSASQPTIAAAMDNLKCPTQSTTNHSTTPTSQTPSSSSASPSHHHACSLPQASAGQHRSSPNSRTSPPNTSTPISTISSSPHQANQNHGSPSAVPIGPSNVVDAATATITAAVVSVAANNVTATSAVTVAASSHHQQHQQHVAASQQRSWVH